MKIRSCEIKSFGKLKDKQIEFSGGINIVRGNNEAGKSTLSAFIKYVLYGYTGKGRDEKSNDKIHYTPWNGEKASGALVLESRRGEIFRAERSGDGKNGSARIINSVGSECFDGLCAGEALFGIDSLTFSKSAFVGQNDIEGGGMKDVGESIEKVLLDSEEDTNFEKVNKNLTNERNVLYNKMRKTGKLFELRQKLDDLITHRDSCAENHNSLISHKYFVEKTGKRIEEYKKLLEALALELENIMAYEAAEKLQKIEQLQKNMQESYDECESKRKLLQKGDFLPDRRYLDELNKCYLDFLAIKSEIIRGESELKAAQREYGNKIDESPFTEKLSEGTELGTEKIHSLYKMAKTLFEKAKKQRKTAIILACLIITLPVAIIFFILSGKNRKKLEALLSDYEFADFSVLEKLNCECDDILFGIKKAKESYNLSKKKIEEIKIEFSVCEGLLSEKLSKIGVSFEKGQPEDISEHIRDVVLPNLSKEISDFTAAIQAYKSSKDTYEALVETTDTEKLYELSKKKLDSAPVRNMDAVNREIRYYEDAKRSLEEKLNESKSEIVRLTAITRDPLQLEEEIVKTEKELSQETDNYEAIELAIELISNSREDLRNNVLPEISKRASVIFSKITGGKYRGLFFDTDFCVKVLEERDTETRSIGFVSAGAVDAAYISLRIALSEFLCSEKPTFIFDDSFVKLDDERLENITHILLELSEEYQIIILTCHKREEMLFKDNARVIVLE